MINWTPVSEMERRDLEEECRSLRFTCEQLYKKNKRLTERIKERCKNTKDMFEEDDK